MFSKLFLQHFCFWMMGCDWTVNARAVFIPNFQLEKCTEFKNKEANIFDTSEVDTHIENDTHVFFIGTVKFNNLINTLPFRFYTERYDRGQWIVQVMDRKYDDLCTAAHDKTQSMYPKMDSFPSCPIKAGTIWDLNMIPFNLPEHILDTLPHHYYGKWRGTFVGEFMVDGVKKHECRRAHGDIFEDGKPKGLGKMIGG